MNGNKSAFIVGYTGEIGEQLVKIIRDNNLFERVLLIGRRKVDNPVYEASNMEQVIVNFDNLEEHKNVFQNIEHGFTTLGANRGSNQSEQYKVAHDYIFNVAKVAQQMGCKHFHLLSAGSANPESRMFYLRTKGETERDVKALNFPVLSIYRPGFFLSKRTDGRPGEKLSKTLIWGPLSSLAPTWMTIPVDTVAKAMLMPSFRPPSVENEVLIFENAPMHRLGAEFDAKFKK